MLHAHVTPSEWILSGLIVGCVLLCLLAEVRPRKRDREGRPASSSDEDQHEPDLPLAA